MRLNKLPALTVIVGAMFSFTYLGLIGNRCPCTNTLSLKRIPYTREKHTIAGAPQSSGYNIAGVAR